MAIKHFQLISLEEFKNSEFFDITKADKEYMKDNLIIEAISISSEIINFISGGQIEEDFNEDKINETNLNSIKVAVERLTNYYVRNGVEYMRATSTSFSMGQTNFQVNNPDDQMYIPPEVFHSLKKSGYLLDAIQISLFKDFGNPLEQDGCQSVYPNPWDEETKRQLDLLYLKNDANSGVYSRDKSVDVVYENGANGYQLNLEVDLTQNPDLEEIRQTANNALSRANTALQQSNDAIEAADNALDVANEAKSLIDAADAKATNALNTANTANQNSLTAIQGVNDLSSRVSANETNITNLQTNLTNTNSTVSNLSNEVNNLGTRVSTAEDLILAVETDLEERKQDKLVSGENIKTVNNQSLVGSGNVDIPSGLRYIGYFNYTSDNLTARMPRDIIYEVPNFIFDPKKPFGLGVSRLGYGDTITVFGRNEFNSTNRIADKIDGLYNSIPVNYYNLNSSGSHLEVLNYWNIGDGYISFRINSYGSFSPGLLGVWTYTTQALSSSVVLRVNVYQ